MGQRGNQRGKPGADIEEVHASPLMLVFTGE